MKNKLRFSLAVLMIMILNAGADLASAVTVRGHDGSELALSQIPDIIRHVTGQTSGDFRLKKDSLYIFGAAPQYNQYMDLYTFNLDGTNKHQFTLADTIDSFATPFNYQSVAALPTLETIGSNDGKLLLNFFVDSNGTALTSEAVAVSGKADDENANIEEGSYYVVGGNYETRLKGGVLLDVKGGMTVKGYDDEVTAYLMRDGATLKLQLGYVSLGSDIYTTYANTSESDSTAADSGTWSTTISDGDVPKMLDGTVYFPASMTVGDFDNDGYKNEIAVVYSDRTAVRCVVLQVTQRNPEPEYVHYASFNVSVLKSDTVDTYDYTNDWLGSSLYKAFGGYMDGFSCTYSACTVAGDFDGDGQTEFAVIWKDTTEGDSFHAQYYDNYSSTFRGYTGKIHVRTYKWNGSDFRTEEDVRSFNSFSYDYSYLAASDTYHSTITLGVKATVGDFDGDGGDDIAVLRVMLQDTEHVDLGEWRRYTKFVFGAFVDWYSFDEGSIKPNYHGNSDNDNSNSKGWVGVSTGNPVNYDDGYLYGAKSYNEIRMHYYLRPLTGEETPYPIIDREFDIIAGKFSGTIGDVITRDDLVIKYPQWTGNGGNKLRSHVVLMMNVPGVSNGGAQVHEIMSLSDRDHLLAFAKSDFLEESVTLGDPVKTVDLADLDYTAILQMMPYHVDNITDDGSALTDTPKNFTLFMDTHIDYNNETSTSDTRNMTYSMTSTAETIFALDSKLTETGAAAFQGVRGITSTLLGDTPEGKSIEGIGQLWDKLKDTVETTKTTSSTHASSSDIKMSTQANYHDALFVNAANRYFWRYPIDNPPSWILEQTLSNYGTFNNSQVKTKQTYITFAMSEAGIPTAALGTRDSHYQPYHESGNLFSYPAALEQIEGYEGHKSLLSGGSSAARRWNGSPFNETITFVTATTDQESTKKTNKAGAITKFLSVVDNVFGSSFAHMPYDTVSSFKRTVSNKESISVNIPVALEGAGFTAIFEPYLDVTGATVVGFAVESFRTIESLWSSATSLYAKKPDPSFILPEKFKCTSLGASEHQFATFAANDNDGTAMKGRGIRYTASDYDMETNNLLMNGVKYKITIPVYNASFVNVPQFKVRLSYTKKLDYSVKKTPIGDYTFTSLPGRGNGNHRQFAEFEWTPNVDQGIYYLFAEIDPDNEIKGGEVHKNRHVSSRDKTIADYGGNNMAYFKIGISNTNSVPFDRSELETSYGKVSSASGEGEFWAADLSGTEFPYVEWVKIDGLDFEEFIEQKVDGKTEPVAGEVEVKYVGDKLMTDAVLVGYALKPESSHKSVSEISDTDVGLLFVKEHFAMFPGEEHKLNFHIEPGALENGVGFLLQVYGRKYPLTDIIHGSSGTDTGTGVGSASSGGCEALSLGMAGVMALVLVMRKRSSV